MYRESDHFLDQPTISFTQLYAYYGKKCSVIHWPLEYTHVSPKIYSRQQSKSEFVIFPSLFTALLRKLTVSDLRPPLWLWLVSICDISNIYLFLTGWHVWSRGQAAVLQARTGPCPPDSLLLNQEEAVSGFQTSATKNLPTCFVRDGYYGRIWVNEELTSKKLRFIFVLSDDSFFFPSSPSKLVQCSILWIFCAQFRIVVF